MNFELSNWTWVDWWYLYLSYVLYILLSVYQCRPPSLPFCENMPRFFTRKAQERAENLSRTGWKLAWKISVAQFWVWLTRVEVDSLYLSLCIFLSLSIYIPSSALSLSPFFSTLSPLSLSLSSLPTLPLLHFAYACAKLICLIELINAASSAVARERKRQAVAGEACSKVWAVCQFL